MTHFWNGIRHLYATPAHSCHAVCTRNKSIAAATVPPCHATQTTTSMNRNKTGNESTNNNEARSYNHCCIGKATSIKYSECLFVALGRPHAMRMHRIVICGLSGSTMLFHVISQAECLSGKRLLNTKWVFWPSLQLWNIFHSKNNSTRFYHKCT
jgi:hypothetical protein